MLIFFQFNLTVWFSFQIIRLSFSNFSLEGQSSCGYDSLTIHDGDNDQARVLEKLCGSDLPQDVYSTGSDLFLHFKTDVSETERGFSITYDIINHLGIYSLSN